MSDHATGQTADWRSFKPRVGDRDAALEQLRTIFYKDHSYNNERFPNGKGAIPSDVTVLDLIPLVKATQTLELLSDDGMQKLFDMNEELQKMMHTYRPGGRGILLDATPRSKPCPSGETRPFHDLSSSSFLSREGVNTFRRAVGRILLGKNSNTTGSVDLPHLEENLKAVSGLPGREFQLTEKEREYLGDDGLYKMAFQSACYLPLLDPAKDKELYGAFKAMQNFLMNQTTINADGAYTRLCQTTKGLLEASREK
jgi:hypothetical protein